MTANRSSTRIGRYLDRRSSLGFFALIVIPVLVVFFATSSRSVPYNVDAFANMVPAWSLGARGTVDLPEYADLTGPDYRGTVGWFVSVDGATVSKYPPGAALWGAPFYVVGPNDLEIFVGNPTLAPDLPPVKVPIPPMSTGAFAASLATALAAGWLGLTFRMLVSSQRALLASYLMAFGTSAWNVASDQLWQHGPGMMWLALGGYLALSSRFWSSGLAYGAALLTRPPTAVVAAATGLYGTLRMRSWKPVLRIGAGAGLGLVALIAYNAWVFGEASISGGYSDGFTDTALNSGVGWWLGNMMRALVDPTRGLLVWSPFLVVLIPGLRAAWRAASPAAQGSALGAVVYLLVQYKANRFSGGSGFFGYRYPLEALAAAAPVLMLSYREWVASRPMAQRLFVALAAMAVALQTVAVLFR
jgi:alpha-1,2-mannosyltransferase